MAQYIDKDALVAKIQKRIKFQQTCIKTEYRLTGKAEEEIILEYNQLLSFIDTLEVKEVDLEEEINHWQGCKAFPEGVNITPLPKAMDIVERTAKHFFELGIKSQKGE